MCAIYIYKSFCVCSRAFPSTCTLTFFAVLSLIVFFFLNTSLRIYSFFNVRTLAQVRRTARRASEWPFGRPSGKTTAGATHR